jgi:hypothetical protein
MILFNYRIEGLHKEMAFQKLDDTLGIKTILLINQRQLSIIFLNSF